MYIIFRDRKSKNKDQIELEQRIPMIRKTVSCDDRHMLYEQNAVNGGYIATAETEVVSLMLYIYF